MKKITVIILAVIMTVLMSGCKSPNFANIDPYQEPEEGETIITGTVEQVSGNTIVIHDGEGGRYSFTYSDEITVVENGWYVVDLSADSFRGKEIMVICSDRIMETYPAMLSDVRMIITE